MASALGPHNLLRAYATSCGGWGETQTHGTGIPSRSSREAKVVLPDETARHHGNPLTPLLLGFPGTPAQRPGRCSVWGWWPPESPATHHRTRPQRCRSAALPGPAGTRTAPTPTACGPRTVALHLPLPCPTLSISGPVTQGRDWLILCDPPASIYQTDPGSSERTPPHHTVPLRGLGNEVLFPAFCQLSLTSQSPRGTWTGAQTRARVQGPICSLPVTRPPQRDRG